MPLSTFHEDTRAERVAFLATFGYDPETTPDETSVIFGTFMDEASWVEIDTGNSEPRTIKLKDFTTEQLAALEALKARAIEVTS
jgi:hypothetical protein